MAPDLELPVGQPPSAWRSRGCWCGEEPSTGTPLAGDAASEAADDSTAAMDAGGMQQVQVWARSASPDQKLAALEGCCSPSSLASSCCLPDGAIRRQPTSSRGGQSQGQLPTLLAGGSTSSSVREVRASSSRDGAASSPVASSGLAAVFAARAEARRRAALRQPYLCAEESRAISSSSPCWAAQPQWLRHTAVWPEKWGVTRGQLGELLAKLRAEPNWQRANSVYTLVAEYIIPWTRGTGMGYALLTNQDGPREVNIMVSHAWGENAEEFLEAILRSTVDSDVLFVCALSLYQAEDGAGPSICQQLGSEPHESPFRRVLRHIQARGQKAGWSWRWRFWLRLLPLTCLLLAQVLFYTPILVEGCAPWFSQCYRLSEKSKAHSAFQAALNIAKGKGIWEEVVPGQPAERYSMFVVASAFCMVGAGCSWLFLRYRRVYAGRMLVVPNRELDIYTRLWCVYEIFTAQGLNVPVEVANTLASAGKARSADAACSSPKDTERIRSEIEAGPHSFEIIDQEVYRVTRGARWDAWKISLAYGFSIALTAMGMLRLRLDTGNDPEFSLEPGLGLRVIVLSLTVFGVFSLGVVLKVASVYRVFRHYRGAPPLSRVLLLAGSGVAIGLPVQLVDSALEGGLPHYLFVLKAFSIVLLAGGLHMLAAMLASYALPKGVRTSGRIWILASISAVLFTWMMASDFLIPDEDMQPSLHCPTCFTQLYPNVVCNASLVVGFFWTPAYVSWSAALRWGVRLQRARRLEKPECETGAAEHAEASGASDPTAADEMA